MTTPGPKNDGADAPPKGKGTRRRRKTRETTESRAKRLGYPSDLYRDRWWAEGEAPPDVDPGPTPPNPPPDNCRGYGMDGDGYEDERTSIPPRR